MIYCISDLHGEEDRFLAMLKAIRFRKKDRLYILGDRPAVFAVAVSPIPDAARFRLEITRGNPAARLYERNGFQQIDYDQMVYDVN